MEKRVVTAKTILYVYGTLRTGEKDNLSVTKGMLFDVGSFPALLLSGPDDKLTDVILERIETNRPLTDYDQYEGYYPSHPEHSLYIRREFLDGWIYEFNNPCDNLLQIPSGDWLKHCEQHNKGRLFNRLSG